VCDTCKVMTKTAILKHTLCSYNEYVINIYIIRND
jgi:hypothetical protein